MDTRLLILTIGDIKGNIEISATNHTNSGPNLKYLGNVHCFLNVIISLKRPLVVTTICIQA